MKKKLTILLATVLSGALLAGCNKTNNSAEGNSANTSASLADGINAESLQGAVDGSAEAAEPLSEDGYLSKYTASDYVTL